MPTVLIVDDNALVLQLLEQQLEDHYEPIRASNGKLGVEAAREHRPALILMDLTMPVMDGWTAIRAIRADASTASIPIIALSANQDADDVARALAAGADAYVAKPIDEAMLRNTITRLLASSGTWKRASVPGEPPAAAPKGRVAGEPPKR